MILVRFLDWSRCPSPSTRQGGGGVAADDDVAVLVDGGELAIDEPLARDLALPGDRCAAGHYVARPESRCEANAQSPQCAVAEPIRQQTGTIAAGQHPHAEHRLVAAGLGIDLVMMIGIEVVRCPGIAHELRARERAAHKGRRCITDVDRWERGSIARHSAILLPVSTRVRRATCTFSPR